MANEERRFQKVVQDWDAVTDSFDRMLEELRAELAELDEKPDHEAKLDHGADDV